MLNYINEWAYFLIIAFSTYLFVYYWRNARLFYYGSKFDGPWAWPIFGNVLKAAGKTDRILDLFDYYLRKQKGIGRLYVGNALYICLTKPEHFKIVLNSPSAYEKDDLYKFVKVLVGEGLFTAPVPKWKRNRKLMLPVFNLKTLIGFVKIFSEQSETLVKNLENYVDKGFFDVYPVIHECTLAMICETNLGIKLDDTQEYRDYTKALVESMHIICTRGISVWLHLDIIFNLTAMSRKLSEYTDRITKLSMKIIKQRRNYLTRRESIDADFDIVPKCTSLLERMLELSEREPGTFSEQQILDEVKTITFAGSETSGATMSFTLIMLGINQDLQDKVYEELQDVFNHSDRPVEYEDLANMDYLERVIKETLRLFPPGPMYLRKITEDINIGSHLVPKGSTCVLCAFYTQRNPEIWEDPLKFDPDRFLPENVAKRHPYSYLPFSAGPRNCIGFKYAMFSMKSTLATVLRNYQVFTPYKSVEDVKVRVDIVTRCANGFNIALKKRENI